MKYLFLLFLLLFSGVISLVGQVPYTPLPESESIWYEVDFFQHKMFDDTIINEINYKKIYRSIGDSSFNQSISTLEIFIREENKQWFFSWSELPIVAFNLNPGEEIEIFGWNSPLIAKSLYIDTLMLKNGEMRNRHHIEIRESNLLDCNGSNNCYETVWIEGIGSVEGFFHSEPDLYFSYEDGNRLLCFENEDSLLYTRWDSIGCNMKKIGVGIEDIKLSDNIDIYPNPISTNQYLSISENISIKDVLVYTTTGQLVDAQHSFPLLLNQAKGIYFIKIITESLDSYHFKLVVQ